MESRAKLFGHPIHPILIPFPLGLLTTSVVFDVVYLLTGNGKWSEIAFWMIVAGVVGGLAAAVFGAIDFSRVPDGTRALLDRRLARSPERNHGGAIRCELVVAFGRAHGAWRRPDRSLGARRRSGGANGLVRWRAGREVGRGGGKRGASERAQFALRTSGERGLGWGAKREEKVAP